MPERFKGEHGEAIPEAEAVYPGVKDVAVNEVPSLLVEAVSQPLQPAERLRSGRHR